MYLHSAVVAFGAQIDTRVGRHGRSRTAFGLTATHFRGEGPGGRNKDADETRGEEGTGDVFVGLLPIFGQGDDDARQSGTGTGRRHGDDDAHAALHFHHSSDVQNAAIQRTGIEQAACR